MDTITDFQVWLANVELEGHEEVYSLYRAVRDTTEWGSFSVVTAKGSEQWIVTALHVDQKLRLASAHARQTFLAYLEREHCGEMGMEEWLGHQQALVEQD